MRFLALFSLWLAGVAFGQDEVAVRSDDFAHRHKHKHHGCARGVHIIAARGNGTAEGYGIMRPMMLAVKDAIPHSTNVSVSYPKDGTTQEGNTPGTRHQKHLIEEYARRCPHTPIVLVGYSEGAGLTMNTICGTSNPGFEVTKPLAKKFHRNVLAVVVYGDYTNIGGQSYDKGTCKHNSLYPRSKPHGCHAMAHKIHSYCNAHDPVCCRTGHDPREHYTYFKRYDTKMAHWVKRQFKKHKHRHHKHPH